MRITFHPPTRDTSKINTLINEIFAADHRALLNYLAYPYSDQVLYLIDGAIQCIRALNQKPSISTVKYFLINAVDSKNNPLIYKQANSYISEWERAAFKINENKLNQMHKNIQIQSKNEAGF
jgi:hypothetical protein